MDLGATVCKPKSPHCEACPIEAYCEARRLSDPADYPRRDKRKAKPRRYGVVWILEVRDQIALVRRPVRGLLGGMMGLPTTEWRDQAWSDDDVLSCSPIVGTSRDLGVVEHVFTHFTLQLRVLAGTGGWPDALWSPRTRLQALPSVFLKCALAAGLGDTTQSQREPR
jgi:A/G-specific adenine glycosylase